MRNPPLKQPLQVWVVFTYFPQNQRQRPKGTVGIDGPLTEVFDGRFVELVQGRPCE